MSTDPRFRPPREKRGILWSLGGLFLLLVALFLIQLFGPNPPIVVSPQTTYITAPLYADGLPNYKQVVLDRYRQGVTPENNAAALLWPAVWPGELDPPQYAAIAAELGLHQIPSAKDAATNVYKEPTKSRLVAWLQKQPAATAKSSDKQATAVAAPTAETPGEKVGGAEESSNGTAEAVIERARNAPLEDRPNPATCPLGGR